MFYFKVTGKEVKYEKGNLLLNPELALSEFEYGFYNVKDFRNGVCLGEYIFLDTSVEPYFESIAILAGLKATNSGSMSKRKIRSASSGAVKPKKAIESATTK